MIPVSSGNKATVSIWVLSRWVVNLAVLLLILFSYFIRLQGGGVIPPLNEKQMIEVGGFHNIFI